ncbi:TetR/AcrR family transcriptional regulator [Nakamurella aerolata]|uniref:TetR/AcrR family transcriptional regulator n=1 Tax=Nakamurella aerolata TaxID=1656892 RepID=A0A849ACR4_9ACTN|nr:TetR/AcrR family transcriptional regulator [Nakamurella aerolata]NNG37523.1 TetR/AcrR family transcriptional regulator [Nakamurella aerolata]
MVNNRRGRPASDSDVRERIVSAARSAFLERGYAATTVRGIAEAAGVSHSLINYHFGGKEGLFAQVIDLAVGPGQILDRVATLSSAREFAPQLLDAALGWWELPQVQQRLRELLAAAATDAAAGAVFASYLQVNVVDRLLEVLPVPAGPDARGRVSAAAAVIAGVFLTRYVLHLAPIAQLSRAEVVRFAGPTLAAALAGPLPAPGVSARGTR